MPVPQSDALPWLARDEWSRGRIPSSEQTRIALPWILTAIIGGTTFLFLGSQGLLRPSRALLADGRFQAALPFVVAALALLIWSVRRTFVAIRSGSSVLDLSSVPGVIGGELAGSIRLTRAMRDGESVRLILTCRVTPRHRVRQRKFDQSFTAWTDDREIAASTIVQHGNAVPVRFAIPADARATVENEPDADGSHSVNWTLQAVGIPGEFWRGDYEVPVFRTPQSPPAAPHATLAEAGALFGTVLHGTAVGDLPRELVERPASSRIATHSTGNGLEVRFPVRPGFVIASLWVAATLPLWIAPLVVTRRFPELPALVITAAALCAAFFLNLIPAWLLVVSEPRRIDVGRGEIVAVSGWPFFGRHRRFRLTEFDGIEADPQTFAVLRKNGSAFTRRFFLAPRLQSSAEARWLASEIKQAVRTSTASD